MDDLDVAEQPRCASCGVLMRTEGGAFVCPACGERERIPWVRKPGDDPAILDFPGAR